LLGPDGGMLLVVRDGDRVGFLSWDKVQTSRSTYCWAMGVIMAPEARGKGYGSRAHRMLVEYLFAHTPVNRIEASTEEDNVAEQRALEKAGFLREGRLRGVAFRDGGWRDGFLYGIVREDQTAGRPTGSLPSAVVATIHTSTGSLRELTLLGSGSGDRAVSHSR